MLVTLREKVIAGGAFFAVLAVSSIDFTAASTPSAQAQPVVAPASAVAPVQRRPTKGTLTYQGKPITVRFDKSRLDRSGEKRIGKASFYAELYAGHKMADGNPMNPRGENAASMTLPLGTTAKVTNLETGKSAIVKIQDRGPYVGGRLIDLSPGTAEIIGIDKRQGLARVAVTPIAVPLADGRIKHGAAADDTMVAATLNDESVLHSLGGE